MSIKVWSDIHADHRNVLVYCRRPYSSVEEMQRDLIARHNAVVNPGDTVWCLGDFTLGEKAVQPFLSQLNGEHHLVSGNHGQKDGGRQAPGRRVCAAR